MTQPKFQAGDFVHKHNHHCFQGYVISSGIIDGQEIVSVQHWPENWRFQFRAEQLVKAMPETFDPRGACAEMQIELCKTKKSLAHYKGNCANQIACTHMPTGERITIFARERRSIDLLFGEENVAKALHEIRMAPKTPLFSIDGEGGK